MGTHYKDKTPEAKRDTQQVLGVAVLLVAIPCVLGVFIFGFPPMMFWKAVTIVIGSVAFCFGMVLLVAGIIDYFGGLDD